MTGPIVAHLEQIADGITPPAIDLMVQLIEQNHHDYTATVNAQIDGLEQTVDALRRELNTIRRRIMELYSAGYQPSESAIKAVVFGEEWPS